MKPSYENIIPGQSDKITAVGEEIIYEEVNTFAETSISMKNNIAYTAIKNTASK